MASSTSHIAPSLQELLHLEHFVQGGGLLIHRQVHSVLAGKHTSKLRGRGLDFEEVRKYVAGDDVRSIDWKVTARTRTPYTKLFTEEKERPVFTLTDLTSLMFFGSTVFTKNAIAAQVAALSGFRTLKVGDRFGGIVFGDQQQHIIGPKRSRNAVLNYLGRVVEMNHQLLERKKMERNIDRLNAMLQRTLMTITHDYVVPIISDFTLANDLTRKHLINLSHHNDVILVHITDPLETQLGEQNMVVTDGDSQLLYHKKHRRLAKYIDQRQEHVEKFMTSLRKFNIVHINLTTEQSASEQIKEVLGRRI